MYLNMEVTVFQNFRAIFICISFESYVLVIIIIIYNFHLQNFTDFKVCLPLFERASTLNITFISVQSIEMEVLQWSKEFL